MYNTYDETFILRPRDCDLNEKWRPSAILETMQDAAGAHSILLGCGRDELIRKNMVWVIARCELHMDRYPSVGEQITVHTFPTPTRICFFPRYYIFTDAHGEMIGKAGTLWLLLDVATRRMLPPGDVGKLIDSCLHAPELKEGRIQARSDSWANIGHSAALAVDYLIRKRQELLENSEEAKA